MASYQKKEIITNGLISTIPGFLMGGPFGIAAVLGVTAVAAHLEQKKDDEIKERKRMNDILVEQEMNQRIQEHTDTLNEIKRLWVNEQRPRYKYGSFEMERRLNRINPGDELKGKLYMSHWPNGTRPTSDEPHVEVDVVAYNEKDFLARLKRDYNKGIQMYCLGMYWGVHRFSRGYMLDGKMIVCW